MRLSFFEWLGEVLGSVIRFIIDALSGFFGLFADAGEDFLAGLSRALGMDQSFLSLIALVVGLIVLGFGVRNLVRRAFVSGGILLLLGLWMLSWVVA